MVAGNILVNLSGAGLLDTAFTGSHAVMLTLLVAQNTSGAFIPVQCDNSGKLVTTS